MEANYKIERLSKNEIKYVIEWAAREGWNPGLHDLSCFYQADPQGFFGGKLDGKLIAVASAVIYDEHFAFCGFYIVDKAYRGRGYGLALTKARLAYIGERNAGLDGVINMLDKYARLGYKTAYNTKRYVGSQLTSSKSADNHIIPLSQIDFNMLCSYDRQHFPAPRETFLRCWIEQPEGAALGYMSKGELCGYGVLRACQNGFKIGPLFANDANIADELLQNLLAYSKGQEFFIDIPENNPHAPALIKKYQLESVFETSRMYLREEPQLPMDQIFGITTFELG